MADLVTKKEVEVLARQTGESPRKCYFWLLADKLRGAPPLIQHVEPEPAPVVEPPRAPEPFQLSF